MPIYVVKTKGYTGEKEKKMRGYFKQVFSKKSGIFNARTRIHIPYIFPYICLLFSTPVNADTAVQSGTTLHSNLSQITASATSYDAKANIGVASLSAETSNTTNTPNTRTTQTANFNNSTNTTIPQNNVQNLKGFGLPKGITGYTDYSTTSSTLLKKEVGVGTRAIKPQAEGYEPKLGQVSVIPLAQKDLEKYDFEENHFWTKRDDVINGFSIRTAQKYYGNLFDLIHDNFIRPLSYKDIANKLLESLSGFTEQISIDISTGRMLLHNKDYKLIGNYKKIDDNDKNGWVDIYINTILTLRKSNKSIGGATQEQILYLTTLYLLKSLDENATYLDPTTNMERQKRLATTTLGFTHRKTPAGLQVLSITKDSPAYYSNIRQGDIITHINGIATTTLKDEQIEYILGGTDMDTTMHINYVPYISKQPSETYIRKNRVIIPATTPNLIDGLPVITIANFRDGSAHELKQSVELLADSIRKTGGLILDLRGNISGNPTEAIESANLFINGGNILTSARQVADPEIKTYTAKSGDILNGAPIVIMVDNTTKGSAEIFASIFDGTKRAVIIGTPTFGEGTIAGTYSLPDNSSVSFAIEEAKNAKGITPNKIGVVPLICTSNIMSDKDIQTLTANITAGKFKDNRPDTNNKTADTINAIRNSCRAIYPNATTANINVRVAGALLSTPNTYHKLLGK